MGQMNKKCSKAFLRGLFLTSESGTWHTSRTIRMSLCLVP